MPYFLQTLITLSLHQATSPTQSFPQEKENSRQLFNDEFNEGLLKECGVYNFQLPTIHKRMKVPLSLQKFLHTARQVLQLFRDLGFTPHQVRAVIRRRPMVLKSNVDLLKSKMDILTTVGLTTEDLAMVITRNPRFLCLSSEENINPKIRFLANLFGSEAHLSQAIKKAPGILSSKSDVSSNVTKKLKLMKSIGFLEDEIKYMLRKYPRILCVNIETLDKRLKHAANLGLTDEEIKQVIAKRPLMLLLSVDKIQNNMNFLTHTAGFEPNIVCNYPIFLFYSVKKRLKPRFMLYKYLIQSSEPLPLSLAGMFAQTDEDFFLLVPK